ncbi:MAG TPA: D-alanyl-D-alanine carboxypeptidase family protein [Solirubrobacterales bacterium]
MRLRRPGALLVVAALLALAATPAAASPGRDSRKQGADPLGIEARSWALMDAETGELLTSHAARQKLPIASTTKLMTAWVTLHEARLSQIVRARRYIPEYGESLMGLRTGQRISIHDLLYGLILRSGNDAAHTLAIEVGGSIPRFVSQMNRDARAMGLTDTHYANPVGLDQKGNYSSAADLATLTRHLLAIPAFAKIADTREVELRSVRPRRRIATINELLEMAPWVNGVKTGHTFGALYVLVGSGRRKGKELIAVAIGAPSDEYRFSDDLKLLEYGFTLYRHRTPVHAGEQLALPTIRYTDGSLPLRAAHGLTVDTRRGEHLGVQVRAPHQVEGPIRRGAKLGRASVFVAGRPAGTVALEAGRAVPKAGFLDRSREWVEDHPVPIVVALFVILMVGVSLYRRRGRGSTAT